MQNRLFSSKQTTCEQAISSFLIALEASRRSPFTVHWYEDHLLLFAEWLGKVNLEIIDANTVRSFLQHLIDKGLADATVHGYYRAMRAWLNWCREEELIPESPMRRVKAPKVKKTVVPSYSEDDLHTLFAACDRDRRWGRRDRAIIALLLDTGIRASELCGLRLEDVEQRRVKVTGKGNKERYLPLSAEVGRSIRHYIERERPDGDDHLFLAVNGTPLGYQGLNQMIHRRTERVGIKVSGVHRFRHTFALNWAKAGGPLQALQTLLGHETPTMSMRYGVMANEDALNLHSLYSPLKTLGASRLSGPQSRRRPR